MSEPKMIAGITVPSIEDVENANLNTDLTKTEDTTVRGSAAVTLRLSGASYSQIAQTLGYPTALRARQAVERTLAEAADSPEDHAQLRYLESRRLERLLTTVWRRAGNDQDESHLAYVRTALAIIDRHARLNGLDAPTQMTVFTPSSIDMEKWVRGMVAQVAASANQEADIIDAEVVDG